ARFPTTAPEAWHLLRDTLPAGRGRVLNPCSVHPLRARAQAILRRSCPHRPRRSQARPRALRGSRRRRGCAVAS
ncbi:MAG: hypothetical protein AVDCRST_MAG93-2385, partial [uncultured Chloroflexia bacterium]